MPQGITGNDPARLDITGCDGISRGTTGYHTVQRDIEGHEAAGRETAASMMIPCVKKARMPLPVFPMILA
jgi:hypothetical protein